MLQQQILALTLRHIHTLPGGPLPLLREDALVRALCPGALRAGLLRAAWRTALCAWRWRKASGFLPHSSFVFSTPETVCGSLGACLPVNVCAEFSSNL